MLDFACVAVILQETLVLELRTLFILCLLVARTRSLRCNLPPVEHKCS